MVDASLRMSIVNLFKALRDELKVSIVYITHDLATAYYISDRVLIMQRGKAVESGNARAVLDNPQHPYSILSEERRSVAGRRGQANDDGRRGTGFIGDLNFQTWSEHNAQCRSQAGPRFRHRRDGPAAVRSLHRASRPLRLWRHLRARPPDGGQAGIPQGRARAGARARADDHALSGRQFRLGLQLGGWRRPGEGSPRAARPRLDVDRAQHLRHERIRRLVPRRRYRADAGGQSRHARRRCGTQPGRILQPSERHRALRSAPQARLRASRTTSSSGAWATRWTARGRWRRRPRPNMAGSPPKPPR